MIAPVITTIPPPASTSPPTRCRSVVFLTTHRLTEVTTRLPLNPHAHVGSVLLEVVPAPPAPAAPAVAEPADAGHFPELTHPATVAAFATRWLYCAPPCWQPTH